MSLSIWKRIFRAPYGRSLAICILLQGIVMSIGSPLLPIILSNKVGLDKTQITAFYLINALFGIIVILGSGYLSDGIVARYKLVIIGGLITTVGYLGLALATQPIHAFIAGPITVAVSVMFPQLFAVAKAGIVADWEREAQVMGITALRTLYSFGFILGTAIASWLAQVIEIQTVYFLVAAALLFLTLLVAIVIYRIEKHSDFQPAQPKTRPNLVESVPLPTARFVMPLYALIVPLTALTLMRGADSTRSVYLSLVVFQLFHNASLAPLLFGITGAAELFTMGMLGYVSSKTGEKIAITGGALVGAFYFAVLSVTQSIPVLYAIHMIYGIFNAALLGVAMAYIQGLLSQRAGLGGSVYVAMMNLGSLIGILSPSIVSGYDQRIFIIPAILCIVGAALLMCGDRTAQIEKRLNAALTVGLPTNDRNANRQV